MDLTIFAPAFYPNKHKVRYFMASAVQNGLQSALHVYGMGEPYTTWMDVQVHRLLPLVRECPTSHVLLTDTSDVLCAGTLTDIHLGYQANGMPPLLMGVEHDGGLNAGGWMGEREAALKALEAVAVHEISGDPQVRWRDLYANGLLELKPDTGRGVFYVGGGSELDFDVGGYALWGDTAPCFLHCAGGFTDPATGKDDRLAVWWQQLGGKAL